MLGKNAYSKEESFNSCYIHSLNIPSVIHMNYKILDQVTTSSWETLLSSLMNPKLDKHS